MIKKEDILNRISEEDIFRKYIDQNFSIKKNFKSELRDDPVPSANIHPYQGSLIYTDFGDESYDCFGYVEKKFGVSFEEALKIIAQDFNITGGKLADYDRPAPIKVIPKIERKEKSKFEWEDKPFNSHELAYFDQFNVNQHVKTKDALEEYKFRPLKTFRFFSTKKQEWSTWIDTSINHPAYLIEINGNQKIYRPLDKTLKWLSNTSNEDIFGLEQIKEHQKRIGILAGQKDILSLYMNTGVRGVGMNSEGANISVDLYVELTQLADEIFMLYDNDKTGIKKMLQTEEFYPVKAYYMNKFLRYSCLKGSKGIKDVAKWYEYMKIRNLKRDRISELINNVYEQK